MDETSTNNLPDNSTGDSGGDNTPSQQPAENQSADASGKQPDTQGSSDKGGDTPSPDSKQPTGDSPDSADDIDKWAKSQNIDLENPTPEQTRLITKRLRDTQAAYNKANMKVKSTAEIDKVSSGLFKPDEDATDEEFSRSELAEIKARVAKSEFFSSNPQALDYEADMAKVLADSRKQHGDEFTRVLAQDLSKVYALAKAARSEEDIASARDAGRREANENIARQQQAAGPQPHAVSTTPSSTKLTREDIANMTPSEYRDRQSEILEAMQSGQLK